MEGKAALVTGSSRGLGREIACELASRGARVAVHYRSDREAASETLASLAGARTPSSAPTWPMRTRRTISYRT
jgi:NAD(P)-dependent dehydrogenase (short-subunit alcohol dehydrogenase family)